jgi:hypothetical protein
MVSIMFEIDQKEEAAPPTTAPPTLAPPFGVLVTV